jgi:hypothetical protein
VSWSGEWINDSGALLYRLKNSGRSTTLATPNCAKHHQGNRAAPCKYQFHAILHPELTCSEFTPPHQDT